MRGRTPTRLLGLTAAEWAAVLPVTERSVQRWIAGQTTPPLEHMRAMAEHAGVTLGDVDEALRAPEGET